MTKVLAAPRSLSKLRGARPCLSQLLGFCGQSVAFLGSQLHKPNLTFILCVCVFS